MISLPQVTLICVDGRPVDNSTVDVVLYSMRGVNFSQVKLLCPTCVVGLPASIEHIYVKPMTKEGYNHFIFKELGKYVSTEFCLVMQRDGFVVHPGMWTDEFLQYDYIGAIWPWFEFDHHEVGNGGFSLRSKKLLETLALNEFDLIENEDTCICRNHRKALESKGIVFATPELAAKFSIEFDTKFGAWGTHNSFGFHELKNKPDLSNIVKECTNEAHR